MLKKVRVSCSLSGSLKLRSCAEMVDILESYMQTSSRDAIEVASSSKAALMVCSHVGRWSRSDACQKRNRGVRAGGESEAVRGIGCFPK